MTPPPPDPTDDELISAVLDGAATLDETARVEADPDLQARLAELRSVRDQIAALDPPTVDAGRRDDHIAAALATSDTAANVTSLSRAADRAWWNGPAVKAAAGIAAALLLIPAVGLLLDGGSDDEQSTETAMNLSDADLESSDGSEGGDGEAGSPEEAAAVEADSAEMAPATTAASGFGGDDGSAGLVVVRLGRFATVADAIDAFAIEAATDTPSDAVLVERSGGSTRVSSCAGDSAGLIGRATVGGRTILIVTEPDGTVRVLDLRTCTPATD